MKLASLFALVLVGNLSAAGREIPKEDPLPGVTSALVIAGSDKRGTIYGIYDLSEQIGVSLLWEVRQANAGEYAPKRKE